MPTALDVATASGDEINRYAVDWLREQITDEQKAAEMYGKMAGLLEDAARSPRHTLGRSDLTTVKERQLYRDASNILGGIATDDMKHEAMLTKLVREFGGSPPGGGLDALFGQGVGEEETRRLIFAVQKVAELRKELKDPNLDPNRRKSIEALVKSAEQHGFKFERE